MESLGQLTGGVAHAFNNALTAIVRNLELVKQNGAVEGIALAQIDAALAAARNDASIVSQMLVFARKRMMRPLTLDLNKTLEEIAALIARSCNKSMELKFELGSDLKPARADPSQLQTSILNLVLNASDAMPDGGTLTIATANAQLLDHERLPPGDYLAVSVSDNGSGMSNEVMERAFEPFFRTKDIGKGSGLGLSTVYGMARQLGGDVTIVSAPGHGSTIRLLLPAASLDEASAGSKARNRAEAAPAKDASRAKVIFVEDDFLVSMATEEILRDGGFEVHTAARAEQGLELLKQHPDVDLPLTISACRA